MMTTGPIGSNSIAFCTGSVVVPFTSDTTARSCPVTAFTRLDLPTLRNPKNPICTRSPEGVAFKSAIFSPFNRHLAKLRLKPEIAGITRHDGLDIRLAQIVRARVGNLFQFALDKLETAIARGRTCVIHQVFR